MTTNAIPVRPASLHPVRVHVDPALDDRDRLTTAFRLILAIPHLLLVGGPIAALTWTSRPDGDGHWSWGAGGALGAVAGVCALIAWVAIIFTGSAPDGLSRLVRFYMRWRVRAMAYVALLRDEYPPFGDEPYPTDVDLPVVLEPRNRLTVAFRPILVIPQVIAVLLLGFAWWIATVVAWFAILFTGRHPRGLYEFGLGAFRWTIRVEAYLLLLTDEYPPFSLE